MLIDSQNDWKWTLSRKWEIACSSRSWWRHHVLHPDGHCHLVCYIMSRRDDGTDACERSCHGISSSLYGSWSWFCSWVDVLVNAVGNPFVFNNWHALHRFAYAVIAADELTAVSNTIDFRYDDGKSFLNWPIGENIDPAVWISMWTSVAVSHTTKTNQDGSFVPCISCDHQ